MEQNLLKRAAAILEQEFGPDWQYITDTDGTVCQTAGPS